uniref:EH domain-containing protein n=1 Tax=Trichuris muris TaxID=70415 RepID=A0A5S6QE30_TRIMR
MKKEAPLQKTMPMPDALAMFYTAKIKPAEEQLLPTAYSRAPLTDREITCMPSVLFVGEYSTGKTTLINHILQTTYTGSKVGTGPTTANFFILVYGTAEHIIPACRAAQERALPHPGLAKMRAETLERCFIVYCRSALLRHMIVIDTPGIVSSWDEKTKRKGFDYIGGIVQLAKMSDATVFVFDAKTLDIENKDVKSTLKLLNPVGERLVFLLNKADDLPISRVNDLLGDLVWSLSRLMEREGAPNVFVGSFWSRPLRRPNSCVIFEQHMRAFFDYLRNIAHNVYSRRLDEIVARAREVRGLALVFNSLAIEVTTKLTPKVRKKLRKELRKIYPRLAKSNRLSFDDLPPVGKVKHLLRQATMRSIPMVDSDTMDMVEQFVNVDLLKFKNALPLRLHLDSANEPKGKGADNFDWAAVLSEADKRDWKSEFTYLYPSYNYLDAFQLRHILARSGLPLELQKKIWNLADSDGDSLINENEFFLLKYLLNRASKGKAIPDRLPKECQPPPMKRKRPRRDDKGPAEERRPDSSADDGNAKQKKSKRAKKSKKKRSRVSLD